MRYYPKTLERTESDALALRIAENIEKRGYGLWALEILATQTFAGFVGLSDTLLKASFRPAVEVGWRLRRQFWRQGFAREGARLALRFGFENLGLAEIVSFTAQSNLPSRALMRALGMRHDSIDDFRHPAVPADSPLSLHVLYRLSRSQFQKITEPESL